MNNISVLSSLPLPESRTELIELLRSPEIRSKILNAGFFNLAWLVCVVGREQAVIASLALVAVYYLFTVRSLHCALKVMAAPVALGVAVDIVFTRLGVYDFGYDPLLIPLWLVVLWFAFSSTLTRSLGFLTHRPLLTSILGGIGFTFSYGMGYRLGAVEFGIPAPVALTLIGATWACLLPAVYAWLRKVQ